MCVAGTNVTIFSETVTIGPTFLPTAGMNWRQSSGLRNITAMNGTMLTLRGNFVCNGNVENGNGTYQPIGNCDHWSHLFENLVEYATSNYILCIASAVKLSFRKLLTSHVLCGRIMSWQKSLCDAFVKNAPFLCFGR